jgi:hypothetical protein
MEITFCIVENNALLSMMLMIEYEYKLKRKAFLNQTIKVLLMSAFLNNTY